MTKLTSQLRSSRRHWFICLALVVTTAIVYWPVTMAQFLTMDDHAYVTSNPIVQRGLTAQGFVWAFAEPHVANYHPVTWLSHMLDCELFGVHAGWHHVVNLWFHAFNVALVYLVLRSMTGRTRCSAIVAALFAIHPLHVESVAWVSERKDILSAFFFLLMLATWTGYARRGGGMRWYIASVALFALGLLSKPMLVTVPCVLLLLDVWPLGRTRWFAAESVRTDEDPPSRSIGFLLLEKIPFFALTVGMGVMTVIAQGDEGAMASFEQAPLSLRVGNSLVAYVRYLCNFFWPANLAAFYPLNGPWPLAKVLAAALLLVCATLAIIYLSRRRPYLGVGWLWFVGMLVPVIGLVQVGSQAMADRYMYLPLMGLAIMLVWGAAEVVRSLEERAGPSRPGPGRNGPALYPALSLVLSSVMLLSFSAITAKDLRWWNNSEALFARALEVTEPNAFALHNLASSLLQRGETAQAVARYEQACKLQPGNPHLRRALGCALKEDKRYDEALRELGISLRINHKDERTWNILGHVYADQKNWAAAADHYGAAVELNDEDYDSRINLAVAHHQSGQKKAALADLEAALRLNPSDPKPWYMTGCLLLETNQVNAAVEPLRRALSLDGRNADAHYRLGLALMRSGHGDQAIAPLMTAVELSPNSPEPLTKLAWLLATYPEEKLRSGKDAQFLAERASALARSSPQVLSVLAAALAEQKQFDQAAKIAIDAAELAEVAGDLALRTKLQAAAAGYRDGHATRDATLVGADTGEIAP